MEWSDTKMLQLIELYEKRPYLYDFSWIVAAYATLSRDFVAHLHEKIAGVTSVIVYISCVLTS